MYVSPRMWRSAPNFEHFKVEKFSVQKRATSASEAGLEYTFRQLVKIYGKKSAKVYRDKMVQRGLTRKCEVTGAPLFPRSELRTLSMNSTEKCGA